MGVREYGFANQFFGMGQPHLGKLQRNVPLWDTDYPGDRHIRHDPWEPDRLCGWDCAGDSRGIRQQYPAQGSCKNFKYYYQHLCGNFPWDAYDGSGCGGVLWQHAAV